MAFSGDLTDYPLSELLFFLSSNRRSGWLTIQSNTSEVTFTLVQGRLVAANSDDIHERLGQRLLADGAVTSDRLATALAIHHLHASEPLGSTLVNLGYVGVEVVQAALRTQSVDLMFQILIQPPCLFFFERGLPDVHEIEIDIALERDVLEAIRRADEWSTRQLLTSTVRLNPETSADMLLGVITQDWPTIEAIMDGAVTMNEITEQADIGLQEVHTSLSRLHALEVIFIEAGVHPLDEATSPSGSSSGADEHLAIDSREEVYVAVGN